MAETLGIYRRNQHKCSSCGKKNLPEPIAFAQLSRLTNDYVCPQCYVDHNYTLSCEQNTELFDDVAQEMGES